MNVLRGENRFGFRGQLTLDFPDVNMKHYALASKDRTELFAGKPEFPLTEQVGMQILGWCNQCRTQPSANYGTSYPAGRVAQ